MEVSKSGDWGSLTRTILTPFAGPNIFLKERNLIYVFEELSILLFLKLSIEI